ncbi:MAG: WbqC family protein, partial [Bacteroidetes bacterium]|nr:WbqC family protein [Bacteroidota bacterium]
MIPTLCPAYLPNVRYFAWMLAQDKVFFVNNTHFQKQTYRNRTEICGSNGILKLTLPTVHSKEAHQKENEVLISDTIPWQKQHWRSICTAYRSSPYFEFYEQDLEPFYNNPSQLLFDFNLKILLQLLDLIESPISFEIIAFDKKKHERL